MIRKIFNYISAVFAILGILGALIFILSSFALNLTSALFVYSLGITIASVFWGLGYLIEKLTTFADSKK